MKLSVKNLHDEPIMVDLGTEPAWCLKTLERAYHNTYQGKLLDGHFSGSLRIQRTLNQIDVSGSIHASIHPHCDRCLESFQSMITIPVRVTYVPQATLRDESNSDATARTSIADAESELTVWPYQGYEIDVSEAIYETAVLSLPLHFICNETCRGLCPSCGANLNRDTCSCKSIKIDPRLAVLSQLKVK